MAFALAVLKDGWLLQMQPGHFRLVRGERELAPQLLVAGLRVGAMLEPAYRDLVKELGVGDLPLAPVEQAPGAAVQGAAG